MVVHRAAQEAVLLGAGWCADHCRHVALVVGGTDSNRDGIVDSYTDTDSDGWNNTQDGLGSGSGNTPLVVPGTDTNNDGLADGTNRWSTDNIDADKFASFIDLDTDGDGISDNTEAQLTTSYTARCGTDSIGD